MNSLKLTLFSLVIIGCSSSPRPPVVQTVGIDLDGFKVTTSPGWFIVNGNPKGVILNKRTTSEISEVGWALTGDAPAGMSMEKTLTWIKSEKMADANRNRMESVSNNFLLKKVNGLNCFSYKQIARDKKVNQFINAMGLVCVNPRRTAHFVDLNISQRYGVGTKPLDHEPEASKFFKSLNVR